VVPGPRPADLTGGQMTATIQEYAGPPIVSVTRYRMLVETMRPKQWTKNAFVLAAVVFSGRALELDAQLHAWLTFVAFCAISSASYLLNDVRDRETDRLNPRTAGRPIARGDIGVRTALPTAAALAAFALGAAAVVNWETLAAVAAYAVLQVGYSSGLKHVLFVDVMTIAAGFLIRGFAGLLCIEAEISPWLLLATGLLALFLALTKRRGELVAAGKGAVMQRRVLESYSIPLLDELIRVVTPCIVIVYALWGVLGAASDVMLATLPFVLYGIFRVLYLIYDDGGSTEDPSVLALRDAPLRLCIASWAVCAGLITVVTL
jgi:4-hydroxybenzoate polyprenyltransferase